MSSNLDVYALCPCGSGKKVKFCCIRVLPDLDKVARLHESNQPDKALEKLESLAKQYPDAQIIPITRAQLLMEEERFDEAAVIMRGFLNLNPNHGHATSLLAFARYMDVGFHQAKPEIHRAFQICPTTSPDVIASLASQIAEEVVYDSTMSSREHFALALRLTQDDKERQRFFDQLMRIDSASTIPFPLRGSHQLDAIDGTEETAKDRKSAARLAKLGCWEIAAKLFSKVAETDADNWALWRNIGLCHAWDANRDASAEALHKAAELATDYDKAVECETLAQLLELAQVEDFVEVTSTRYTMQSTGRVLSILDEHPRFHRVKNTGEKRPQMVAQYMQMDIDIPSDDTPVTDDNVPSIVADLTLFEWAASGKTAAMMSVVAPKIDGRDAIIKSLESILGDTIESFVEPAHDHDHVHDENCGHDHDDNGTPDVVVREIPKELFGSQDRKFFGSRSPIVDRRARAKQDAIGFVESWSNLPLNRLEAKTPLEVSNDNDFKVRLAAAILVLESISDITALFVDVNDLRKKLNVTPQSPISVDASTPLNSLTVMQLHRLPLSELSDEQLAAIVNRALLIRHAPFVYAVLSELASRDIDKLKGLDALTFYRTFTETCQSIGKRDEALHWVEEARKKVAESDDFEEQLNWAMREFQLRVEDKTDPKLAAVVDRVWNYFGRKLPAIREALAPILKEFKIPIPGETAGGIVLPGGELAEAGSSSGKKLWLPN